ncbi:hypothetical protein BCON_0567g00020 [Botryotinia convoluta]|uniref:Uncharacterized protein n=1 Tax=Botryotinia convoluta TaxID=54673 RepID=A0A4Z1HBZ4_9HELO|nr:hypothetical protein BCON_0567g00020 [Botryotinia convoluta]
MSPFYAYAIQIVSSTTSSYQTGGGNYVITFTTRDVADEWWRAITDAAKTDQQYKEITRVTIQHYTYSNSKINIASTITPPNKAQSFYDKVFFTPFSGSLSVIPTRTLTDHVSRKTYFIRSAVSPTTFWYVNSKKNVVTSQTRRTRFRISFADNDKDKSNNIMIDTDGIKITLAYEDWCRDNSTSIFAQADGTLSVQKNGTNFKFRDFKEGTFEMKEIATVMGDDCGDDGKAVVKTTEGEVWELV